MARTLRHESDHSGKARDYKRSFPVPCTFRRSNSHLTSHPMLPRVQSAVDVKKATDRSSSLDKVGFDASAGCLCN